jgi:hypothetical protein
MVNTDPEKFRRNLESLPSLDAYKEQLTRLKSLDLSGKTIAEVRDIFFDHAGITPFSLNPIPGEAMERLELWRCRRIDETKEDTRLMRTFSYPSAGHSNKVGRANLPGKPVFYGSDSHQAPVFESRPEDGEELFLAKWGFRCDRNVHMRIFLPEIIADGNPARQLALNFYIGMRRLINSVAPSRVEHIIELFRTIAHIYSTERDPYPISSWLSYETMYTYNPVDLILYPCFESQLHPCNFAIHPNFIDYYARLLKVARVRIKSVSGDGLERKIVMEPLEVGEVIGSRIIWNKRNPQNTAWLPGREQ